VSGVGNIDLRALFAEFGTVEYALVIHRKTGRSKRYGYVEMGSESEARAAVAALHDRDHFVRRLMVNEAKACKEWSAGRSIEDESGSVGEEGGPH
jgi:RNA recognition motif-containing protein